MDGVREEVSLTEERRIAYTMSRFPKISETFVLYELLELERQGFSVDIFPLIHEKEGVVHAEAEALTKRAYYFRGLSAGVIKANLYWMMTSPLAYIGVFIRVLLSFSRSPSALLKSFVAIWHASWLAYQVRRLGIHHVHAHFATYPALSAYAAHKLSGVSYSFTAHADDIYVDQTMLVEKVRYARFVATISDYNKRFFREQVGDALVEKVHVVHCGVDTSIFRPIEQSLRGDVLRITSIARLEEKKGHVYLIRACEKLKRAGVPFTCRLIGDGELREEILAEIASRGLQEEVLLLGRQPQSEVKRVLADTDVMVLPSVMAGDGGMEGIPVALMEAMAMSLPVVSTRLSGIPELIEDNVSGLLVPPNDADALALAIQRFHGERELGVHLGARAREKVLDGFDLKKNARQLAQLFM